MSRSVQLIAIRETLRSETLDYATRFVSDDEAGTFSGYAAVFNERNSYNEIVRPGTFARTLAEHQARGTRPPMLWSHRTDEVIGVWTDIREDERGLAVTGKLVTETARAREVLALMKAGALTGLSIGFRPRQQERGPNGVRILSDADLIEISPVALPSAGSARIKQVRTDSAHASAVAAFINSCRQTARALGKD